MDQLNKYNITASLSDLMDQLTCNNYNITGSLSELMDQFNKYISGSRSELIDQLSGAPLTLSSLLILLSFLKMDCDEFSMFSVWSSVNWFPFQSPHRPSQSLFRFQIVSITSRSYNTTRKSVASYYHNSYI